MKHTVVRPMDGSARHLGEDGKEVVKTALHDLILLLDRVSLVYGVGALKHPESMLPSTLDLNKVCELNRGALAVVLEIYRFLSQRSDGRKALLDLGFKPFFEQIKGEGSGGCND